LLVVGGATIAFTLISAAPALAEQFTTLIDTTVMMTMVMYILSAVAIWRLSANETRRGRKVFLRTVSVLSAVFCAVVMVTSSPTLLAITAGTSVLGALGYFFARPKAVAV
jgi:amino acid transporter